jgi:hypothetical protein
MLICCVVICDVARATPSSFAKFRQLIRLISYTAQTLMKDFFHGDGKNTDFEKKLSFIIPCRCKQCSPEAGLASYGLRFINYQIDSYLRRFYADQRPH